MAASGFVLFVLGLFVCFVVKGPKGVRPQYPNTLFLFGVVAMTGVVLFGISMVRLMWMYLP